MAHTRGKHVRTNYYSSSQRVRCLLYVRNTYDDVCQNCGIKVNDLDYRDGPNGGRILGNSYPTIEHVVPFSETRTLRVEDITLFCYGCNQASSKQHDKRRKVRNSTNGNDRNNFSSIPINYDYFGGRQSTKKKKQKGK